MKNLVMGFECEDCSCPIEIDVTEGRAYVVDVDCPSCDKKVQLTVMAREKTSADVPPAGEGA